MPAAWKATMKTLNTAGRAALHCSPAGDTADGAWFAPAGYFELRHDGRLLSFPFQPCACFS
jgi:hypothetical protein